MDGKDFLEKLKELGISQQKVAEILGVTRQTVCAMRKNASIKLSTLETVAKGLGIDLAALINDDNQDEKTQALLREKDEKIKELEATVQRLIGIIEKMQ